MSNIYEKFLLFLRKGVREHRKEIFLILAGYLYPLCQKVATLSFTFCGFCLS